MKKTSWILLIAVIAIVWWAFGKYNSIISLDETVKESRSQVENQYQRRSDLIPNLVKTVKWYASHENSLFTSVTEARAKASQTNVNVNDAASMAKFQANQWELSSALSRLLVTVENYPELKANQNFLELQAQLEWTENRISVERKRFNEKVKEYNIYIRKVPTNIIAALFNFDKANMFEAEEWADTAPEANFEDEINEGEQKINDLDNDIKATEKEIELLQKQKELDALKANTEE